MTRGGGGRFFGPCRGMGITNVITVIIIFNASVEESLKDSLKMIGH